MTGYKDDYIEPRGREMYGDPKRAARFAVGFALIGLLVGALCLAAFALFTAVGHADNGSETDTAPGIYVSQTPVVVIDAGHGGEDGGASGHGCLEKELNLDIAMRLGEFLTLDGATVIYTRTDDRMLYTDNTPGHRKNSDLRERLNIAGKYPGCVFVSVHQNTFPSEECSGLQVYYSKNDPLGKILAQSIQKKVGEYLQPENHRKIKQSGSNIYLLDRISSPAVLVECGFLSNSSDASLLSGVSYRTRLAMCVCEAISEVIFTENQQNTEVIAK